MRTLLTILPLLLVTMISLPTDASYIWVNADDLHLRVDIQLLADLNVVKVPTTTYPLMWRGVMDGINSLNHVDFDDLSEQGKNALYRVQSRYQSLHKSNNNTSLSIALASDTPRFQHYGAALRESGESTLRTQGKVTDWFAYNLQVTTVYEAQDEDTYRLDGSYINILLGNWVLTAGSYGEWYGQGWDSTLLKSTNARALPTINMTRNNAQAIDFPLLTWLGPWTLTTGVSWMDDEDYREINNALLWSFRSSFKPHPNLEFGVSRTAQLCGDNKDCHLETWFKMLIGDTNEYDFSSQYNNPANQLASVDIRWSDTFKGIPLGVYWETMGEDDFQLDNFPPFGKKSYLIGADVSYSIDNHSIKTYFEYSDTYARCGDSNGDCTYEHSAYKGGHRYIGRAIGSTYDNDAFVYALGFIGFVPNGEQWQANLRHMSLNKDNTNRSGKGGNTVASIAEVVNQIDFSYHFSLFNVQTEAGISYMHSNYQNDINNEESVDIWVKWTHTL